MGCKLRIYYYLCLIEASSLVSAAFVTESSCDSTSLLQEIQTKNIASIAVYLFIFIFNC